MTARPYQVKGSTVRSKFDFVHERFGVDARNELEARFEDRDLIPILVSGWYPYELYTEILEAISDVHFAGDRAALESIGAYSAEQALSTVYAAFVRPGGFVEFLRGISRLHHMFYNAGELVVEVEPGGRAASIWHRDKPALAEADLRVAAGFYRKAAELHGAAKDSITCSFTLDPDGAHFRVAW